MTDQHIVEGLTALLECPVCYEIPNPGTRSMAMCKSGHVVCRQCFGSMIGGGQNFSCPKCREKEFYLYPNNFLFSSLANFLSDGKLLKCNNEPCTFEGGPDDLTKHKNICPMLPVYCPKWHCYHKAPFREFMQTRHPCLDAIPMHRQEIVDAGTTRLSWTFTVGLLDLFDVEYDTLSISHNLKPKVLEHPGDPDFRAYFQPCLVGRKKLMFFIGWMGESNHADNNILNLQYHMKIICPTRHGDMGVSTAENLWFTNHVACYHCPDVTLDPPSVYAIEPLHKKRIVVDHTLFSRWLRLCPRDTCSTCNADVSKIGPHLHVYVDFCVKNHAM